MDDELQGSAYGRELVRRLRGLVDAPYEPEESLAPAEKVAASQASLVIGAAMHDSKQQCDAECEAHALLKQVSDASIEVIEVLRQVNLRQ